MAFFWKKENIFLFFIIAYSLNFWNFENLILCQLEMLFWIFTIKFGWRKPDLSYLYAFNWDNNAYFWIEFFQCNLISTSCRSETIESKSLEFKIARAVGWRKVNPCPLPSPISQYAWTIFAGEICSKYSPDGAVGLFSLIL